MGKGHCLPQSFQRLWMSARSGQQWLSHVFWGKQKFSRAESNDDLTGFLPKEKLFTYFIFLGILISKSGVKNGSVLIALGFFISSIHLFFVNWFNLLDCQTLLRDLQKQKYSFSDLRKQSHRDVMKSSIKYLFRLSWELT